MIRDFATKYGKQLNLDRAKKAKSLEDRFSQVVRRGVFLAIDLDKQDFECEANERYKSFVVRSWLKRVPNEALKCNAFVHEEEVRRFSHGYIEFVKFPDGHMLRLDRKMRGAFWAHFCDCFASCPDFPVQEFGSYLADFSRFGEVEAASCKGLVTECEVCDVLKQVGLNKSPGLDGLPYKVYLRMSHMFVPILRMCSTIGLPRELSVVALLRMWSHYWRKMASIFRRV